ncbi:hypothetical protein [Paracoccus indicus]|uniref:hypothetical protein n=1 Tax=Paracoccus indicus TaxID=2079229 RepID=UPI0013B36B05|nr:hypothetical protein [Paracoccus indicus]
MELKSPPGWSEPAPRKTTIFSGCTEDWFARNACGAEPAPEPTPEILLRDLVERAFKS